MFPSQKGPASTARLKAQIKSSHLESEEAKIVRIQWAKMLGITQEKINEIAEEYPLNLLHELYQLSAVISLSKRGT